jgi:putative flippase GtrA
MLQNPLNRESRHAGASLVRFGVSAGLSFGTNLGLTVALHEFCRLPEEAAFATSLVTVFLMNFLVLRYYVFPGSQRSAATQLAMFGLSSVGFRGGEYLAFLVAHTWLGVQYTVAIAAILALSFVCKFLFYRGVVFARRAYA